MKKLAKKLLVFTLSSFILLMSLPLITNATPEVEREITSILAKSENTVDGLPFTPKAEIEVTEGSGKKLQFNYEANHKVTSKEVENGETVYHVVSDIRVPVQVKARVKPNTMSRFFNFVAYGTSKEGTNYDNYSVMYAWTRVKWDAIQKESFNYCKFQQIDIWWYRDRTNLQVYNANFVAAVQGDRYDNGRLFTDTWRSSPKFNPSWRDYYNTNTYTNNNGSYVNWPYVTPAAIGTNGAGSEAEVWDAYGKIASISAKVIPY
jgi:hypothetical protein